MPTNIDNLGFGIRWSDVDVDHYEGYLPNMSDYHMHGYYEVSLILSGDVKVILPKTMHHGTQSRLVLTRPMTSHLILCEPNLLYRRVNLLFANEYLASYVPEWKQLLQSFGKHGKVLILSDTETNEFYDRICTIEKEENPFRKRLLVLLFLSRLSDLTQDDCAAGEELPDYLTNALFYIQEHYAEKIVAAELAWQLGVGRTSLMTGFKKHVGCTLTEYLTRYRLKQAIGFLREKKTLQDIAERCGFGDACNLIRSFRKYFGTTPKQYLKNAADQANPVNI